MLAAWLWFAGVAAATASPEPTRPQLTVAPLRAGGLQIAWPTDALDYLLEFAASLRATVWAVVTNSSAVAGGQFVVSVSLDASRQFFRLRRPNVGPYRRIVFQSVPQELPVATPAQIYSMNPDGSDLRQLTKTDVASTIPVWSPDGQHILFNRGSSFLYVMEAIGEANGGRVFPVRAAQGKADWSPDGKKIVFTAPDAADFSGLWLVDVNVTNRVAGVPTRLRPGTCYAPSWSPDGTRIAFVFAQSPTNSPVINVLNLVTETEFVIDSFPCFSPSWSPDGNRLAFGGVVIDPTSGERTQEIFVANADGSGVAQVTQLGALSIIGVTWSPDGEQVVFSAGDSRSLALYIYKVDMATGRTMLLRHAAALPDWAP